MPIGTALMPISLGLNVVPTGSATMRHGSGDALLWPDSKARPVVEKQGSTLADAESHASDESPPRGRDSMRCCDVIARAAPSPRIGADFERYRAMVDECLRAKVAKAFQEQELAEMLDMPIK
jgi:hypothetical protein